MTGGILVGPMSPETKHGQCANVHHHSCLLSVKGMMLVNTCQWGTLSADCPAVLNATFSLLQQEGSDNLLTNIVVPKGIQQLLLLLLLQERPLLLEVGR